MSPNCLDSGDRSYSIQVDFQLRGKVLEDIEELFASDQHKMRTESSLGYQFQEVETRLFVVIPRH